MNYHKDLNESEVKEFRQWARENFDPIDMVPRITWHPVVRDECNKMLEESGLPKLKWEDLPE